MLGNVFVLYEFYCFCIVVWYDCFWCVCGDFIEVMFDFVECFVLIDWYEVFFFFCVDMFEWDSEVIGMMNVICVLVDFCI